MNILCDKLPEVIWIDGVSYPIKTDFRVWIKATLIFENNTENEFDRLAEIAQLCLKPCSGKRMPNLGELLSALFDFLLCGEKTKKNTCKGQKKEK